MLEGTRRISALLTVLCLVVVGAACGDDDGDDPGASPTSTPPTSAPTTTLSGGEDDTVPVRVYFTRDEKVATTGRDAPPPQVALRSVEWLLDGPNALETGIGMTSAIPDGTELHGISISDAEATVDLNDAFQQTGAGGPMQLRVAQVVFTLTQFDSVETVSIRIDGADVTALGQEGVPAVDLDRGDFEAVTPFVLVESPVPGETVSSPLTITGIANTFEANVRYSVTDAGGQVLADGFTTASAGTGIWGDFSATIEVAGATGPATVTAWEDSAETGEPINVYEVPVQLR